MTKSFLIAALTAALSTAAFAGDSKPVQMTDEQMDQVTAAGNPGADAGFGIDTAKPASDGRIFSSGFFGPGRSGVAVDAGGFGQKGNIPGGGPAEGGWTAGPPHC
jgi:hypothetical protein